MKRCFWTIWCLLFAWTATAQDVHFSQYWESGVLRNPALTGIRNEDYKVVGSYRNQWASMGQPFRTVAIAAETRLPLRYTEADYVTLSALFVSDRAGDASLKSTGVYPCLNYNKHLTDPHNSYLSVGFCGGFVQRSFDPSALTFDNMYQGGQVDPTLGAGEMLPLNKLSYWDLAAGVSFNSSIGEDERIHYIIGLAGYHFTRPKANFYERGEAVNLVMRVNASFDLNFSLNESWSAQVHSNLSLQGPYQEAILGGLICWAPGNRDVQQFQICAGAQMRIGDAIIPMLKLNFKNQSLGLSYDINNSALKAATQMRGGLEIVASFQGLFRGTEERGGYAPRF